MPKKTNIYYNRTNTCDNIKEDGKKCECKLMSGNAYREFDKKGDWTGKWFCRKCNRREALKCGNRRSGNLSPNSSHKIGDIFEELTCKWRGVNNLNIDDDNYTSPIDHSRDPELGIIQTKGALYNDTNRCWSFGNFHREWKKNFDNIICYCTDKYGKNIERIYIFPKDEIIKRGGVTIFKYLYYKGCGWYEQYRVKDDNVIKQVNEMFHKILKKKKNKR